MKAAVVRTYGAPEVLEIREVPDPSPGPGEVVVRIRAFGLNFADLLARMGIYPGTPSPPFIPGMEFSGDVVAGGSGVGAQHKGMRVMGFSRTGSHAELVALRERFCVPMPGSMSYEEGAAFLVTSLSAYHGLVRLANLRQNEKLLIHAAAGGVGLAAVQLARVLGAEIFATASTAVKLDAVKERGADHQLNYPDFAGEVRRLTGGTGVDVVMDSVGGRVFQQSWPLLAGMGRYVLFGLSAATGPGGFSRLRALRAVARMRPLFPPALIGSNRGIFGFNLGTLINKEDYLEEAASTLVGYYNRGELKPVVGRVFPFREVTIAHRFLQTRQSIGKVVVRVDQ